MVSVTATLSSAVGTVLGGVTRALGAVRPAAKPLHPSGVVRHATLHRHGVDPVRNRVPGLGQYAVVRRLRAPSYAAARSSRGGDGT